jgi:RNA-directed DNA polymerase
MDADGETVNEVEASMKALGKGESALQSVGVHQDRGMRTEKRLELGRTPEAAHEADLWAGSEQLKEAAVTKAPGESDPPIVVGDGSAGHMAKGRAEEQRWQSTHARRGMRRQSVSSSLLALRRKAEAEPKHRFRNLYGMIDEGMLYESYGQLKRRAAPGVDGIDVVAYGKELKANIGMLVQRLKDKQYQAKAVRRRYIPKAGGRERPLGIPAMEDKLVQMAARRVLEAIYEADFVEESNGYRPGRGARQTSQKLQHRLFHNRRIKWIVEADIEGFFDNLDHAWMKRMIGQRVDDRAFVRLIGKWLAAGILEENGELVHPDGGTPQGGVISPVLANIYLHYVLDLWMEKIVKPRMEGEVVYERYADDFVCGFEHREEAERYIGWLRKRLGKFGLKLSEAKTGILRFDQFNLRESKMFRFLGFEFYWARTRRDFPTVKRRTSRKKLRSSLAALKEWLKTNRSRGMRWIIEELKAKYRGYWNYYGVIGNSRGLQRFWRESQRLIFKWVNRRSQRRSYNRKGFTALWQASGIEGPRIVERPYQPNASDLFRGKERAVG